MDEPLKCDECDETKDLIVGPDPFMSEIYNDETEVTLCPKCYHEACMDI